MALELDHLVPDDRDPPPREPLVAERFVVLSAMNLSTWKK